VPLKCPPPDKVEVPVHTPLDPKLIADCLPETGMPMEGALKFRDLDDYTLSIETALDTCRSRLARLRQMEAERKPPAK
jgi:hypothetical protein